MTLWSISFLSLAPLLAYFLSVPPLSVRAKPQQETFNTFSPIQCHVSDSPFLTHGLPWLFLPFHLSTISLFPWIFSRALYLLFNYRGAGGKRTFWVAGRSRFQAFAPVGVSIHCSYRVVLSCPSFAAEGLGGPQLSRVLVCSPPLAVPSLGNRARVHFPPVRPLVSPVLGRGTRQAL